MCHTTNGSARVGPTFLHAFGSEATLEGGAIVTVDAPYIRESLRAPQAKARAHYPPSMPVFDTAHLPEDDIDALVAYLQSLE